MAEEKKEKAICPKCGKSVEATASENWDVYHPQCLSLEDLVAMTDKGKRKKRS